jgi:Protein of unknown function (DUF1559)
MLYNKIRFITFRRLCALAVAMALTVLTAANSPAQVDIQPKDFVDATTFASLKIDTQAAAIDKLPVRFQDVSQGFYQRVENLLKSAQGAPLILTASVPQSSDGTVWRLIAPTSIAEGDLKRHAFLANSRLEKLIESLSVFSSNSLKQFSRRYPLSTVDRQAWEQCSASTAKAPVQVLVVMPEYFRNALVELQPTLPESLGGIPSSVLADGLLWMSLGYVPNSGELTITVQSKSDQAAKALVEILPQVLAAGSNMKAPYSQIAKLAAHKFDTTRATISSSQVRLQVKLTEADMSDGMLGSTFKSVFGNLSSGQRLNKLKVILLAIHNFESANRQLPPLKEYRNQDGTSKLSWRVHLLPYLGEVDLYEKFRLNEAWDSPHNKPLLEQLPECYRMTGFQEWTDKLPVGYTTILAPSGKDTALGSTDVVTFSKIQDGTSNTVFLVEVKPEKAVPWTSPQDYVYEPKNPLAGVFLDADGKAAFGFGDGSAQFLDGNLAKETYDHLFRRSDGNAIKW